MNFYLQVAIGALVLGGLVAFIFFTKSRKPPKTHPVAVEVTKTSEGTTIDQFVEVEARVYDNDKRTIYNDKIKAADVRQIRQKYGNLGRTWLRDGKWIYALNKLTSGEYRPVQVPTTLQDPPSELHRALQQQETSIVFNVDESEGILKKYGAIIWIAIIGAVCIFILIAQKMTGG